MSNLATCHRCPNRQPACAGPCPCTLSGRDIIDHARRGDCPAGKFSTPDVVQVHLPDGLAWNQDQHGNDGCGCAE